ncbi:aldo/keto reductase [Enterococcus sp. LJL99]
MKKIMMDGKPIYPIGFGTWHMGDSSAKAEMEIKAIQTGIENGIELIDTAEMYGNGRSEELVGQAIQPYDREKLYLVSKVLPMNASRNQLPISLDQSLKRLKTDYLDMYLLHWQGGVPLQETIDALEKQVQLGKIKAWGVSNFDTSDMQELLTLTKGINCKTNQVLYNLGDRGIDFDLKPFMQQKKIPLMAYSPVAQGDQFGANLLKKPILKEIAEKHQVDVFQILLAWAIRDGNTIAIPQSGNPAHVLNNIHAAMIELDREDFAKINQIYPEPTRKMPLAIC